MRKHFRHSYQWIFMLSLVLGMFIPAFAQDDSTATSQENVGLGNSIYLPFVSGGSNAAETVDTNIADTGSVDAIVEELDTQASAVITNVLITTTQDISVTGFIDSRKLAIDVNGNLYAAFRKKYKFNSNSCYHIFVAKSTNNGVAWTVLNNGKPVETTGDVGQRVPSITVDFTGRIHLVWYGLDQAIECDKVSSGGAERNDRQIKYLRSLDGGTTWITATVGLNIAPISGYTSGKFWQEHPSVYAAQGGALYVVWEGLDSQNSKGRVKLLKSIDGGQVWTSPVANTLYNIPITTTDSALTGAYFSRPTLVADYNNGNKLYVFAYATNNSLAQIVWTNSTNGGQTWSAWQRVYPSSFEQKSVSIAMDSTGAAHVAWHQATAIGGLSKIHYRRYSGTSWGITEIFTSTRSQIYPSITVDDLNQPWMVWSEPPTGVIPAIGGIAFYANKIGTTWVKTQVSSNSRIVFPTLRHQRFGSRARIDLVWTETKTDGTCGATSSAAECRILFGRLHD